MFELNASTDEELPCVMHIPDNIKRLDWVKYNNKPDDETYNKYRDVKYYNLKEFQGMMNSFRMSTNIIEMEVPSNSEVFEFICRSDKHPEYYTSIDDNTLIFDSYSADEDSTLQKSKAMCKGVLLPIFTLSDSFTRVLSSALVFSTQPPVSVWGTVPSYLKLRGFSWKHGINHFMSKRTLVISSRH